MHLVPVSHHLEKLPAFVMVVRLGSITKAANSLSISQAALSQSMKVLEEALDMQLLIRSKAGVRTTEEGELLFQYGNHLLEELELLETKLRNPKKANLARIRIGTHEALAIHLWPEVLESFQAKNPNVLLSIVSGRIDVLVSQVITRNLDLIVTVKPKPLKGLTNQLLYKDNFKFYATSDLRRPIAGIKLTKRVIDKEALAKIPILTDSLAHLSEGESLSQALSENGLYSAQNFQLTSFQAASRLAAKGFGVALLPKKIGDRVDDIKEIKVRRLRPKLFEHGIYCSYSSQSSKDATTSLIIEHLKSQLN